MAFELKVPSPGESISEVEIAQWLVSDGDYVEKDQVICEIDSDKATLELTAEVAGAIKLIAEEGQTVAVGEVVCEIDTDAEAPAGGSKKEEKVKEEKTEAKKESKPDPMPSKKEESSEKEKSSSEKSYATGHPSIAAKKLMDENGIAANQINGSGKDGRITKQDVVAAMAAGISSAPVQGWGGSRDERREKMSMLRRKVAERLVSVKNETAMLTTFNEIDMSNVMALRSQYKDKFRESHDVNLGFMSFFTKAVTEALNHFPAVNAQIDGKEIIFHDYADIGIAVSSPKGLMVPVLRNAEQMSLADIEKEIKRLAIKARDGKLSVDEMTGGTFTITNGGVFGSMMSTPIINPPQVAILGMHNIVERPVAINGKVEIRPIMYVALSYDHRIIDGKESVGFLVKIKEMIENPTKIIFGGKAPEEILLNL
ncbi:MAG: 2-oxoglutarate dehydrogenase complex dihydrolipoyllysine-residue succinyltransferase [Luteibaculum sp.]